MARSETLLASFEVLSKRLQTALPNCPSLFLLHSSQWRCLVSSYSAVTQALNVLLERALSVLGPREQESMWCKLSGPLHALDQAVQEVERCILESLIPSSSTSKHSWLLDKALKLGMSTEIVDLHLHRLLWTSSVVHEQVLRCAPIDGMELDILSVHTKDLCDIWSKVDEENDLLLAKCLLNRIVGEEEEDTRELASFILQRLSCPELSGKRITNVNDLPPFLWVDLKNLKKDGECVGEGSYGKVQEAVWLRGRFAVKDFFYVDEEAFGKEATIQAQLHHPNVIPLVFCSRGPPSQKCSLVMELMQHDLQDILIMERKKAASGMESPFPLLLAVDLMLQIAQGMEYLHSDGLRIMHRDLKSSNILVSLSNSSNASSVTPHVHLKVADFGMSKAKYASSRYTTRHVGATAWRAPEVFEDELGEGHPNARYTNKADVYSFGMVCYEILTGMSPFEGTPQQQIWRKVVLLGERPSLPRHCPPALASYIGRCWHADPDERPTFTQICRMLRYFKACIFLVQDHDNDHHKCAAECNNWLLHPLSASMCADIDDMLRRVVLQFAGILQPQLLVIPLEMYCCRVVLQRFRDEIDVADQIDTPRRGEDIHEFVAEDQSSSQQFRDEIEATDQSNSPGSSTAGIHELVAEDESSSVRPDDPSRWPAKGCFKGKQHGKSAELRNALGLMGDFTYTELRIATNDFSVLIGKVASGNVYHGQLLNGKSIAVKVDYGRVAYKQESFKQELRIASQLRHRNIVPLLGWCSITERKSLLLVYEYMPNGNLAHHIFGEDEPVFGWQQRYKVVGQLAAALKYLHQDSGYRQIVHRNVKTSKLLLDSEWNARLGMSTMSILIEEGHSSQDLTVVGTIGFMAPEYFADNVVSAALDIYSFGVTVLEIATGRRARFSESNCPRRLDEWVWQLYEGGEVMRAADVRLAGKFDEGEMRRLLMLGLACMNTDPQARPTIEELLRILSKVSDPPPPRITTKQLNESEYFC